MKSRFAEAMAKLPLVAILRGITPAESPAILRALLAEGFLLIEAPLNSPEPYESIRAMRAIAPPEALVGAGTVKTTDEVAGVAERFSATPFDLDGNFWSHRGEACTFDVMLEEFGLNAPALQRNPHFAERQLDELHGLRRDAIAIEP